MDGRRFDRLTKTMSAWISRRRFVAGLGAVAAGSLLRVPHHQGDRRDLQEIRDQSGRAAQLPLRERFENQLFDPVRLPKFIDTVRSLGEQGTRAADDSGNPLWNDDQLTGFLAQIDVIPLAVSAGTDAHLDQWVCDNTRRCPPTQPAGTPEASGGSARLGTMSGAGVRAMAPSSPEATSAAGSPKRPTICATYCLETWSACTPDLCGQAGITTDQGCRTFCFWNFVTCFVDCLDATMIPCTGDCG